MGVGLLRVQSRGPAGFLVVGAGPEPAETERFFLQVLAQQAGVALANARLHAREREQAEKLRASNLALQRTMEIHDRLTQVALAGAGQDGIAQAVYDLTGYPAAIEDRSVTCGRGRAPAVPARYPKDPPEHRDSLLRRALKAAAPVRDGERLVSVAVLGGNAMGALVLHDPDGTAVETERVAIEHATTVLAMELARLQTVAEAETRLRSNLVIELVEGTDGAQALSRAQALGYDLGRPHRVVLVEGAGAVTMSMPCSVPYAGPRGKRGWGRCSRPGSATSSSWPTRQKRRGRSSGRSSQANCTAPTAGSVWAAPAAAWRNSRTPTGSAAGAENPAGRRRA